jgi:membrane protein CcdC involved in cytochrome C biogenesis
MTLSSTFKRWLALAGLDFHVLVTLLFRGWVVLAGGATALLLPIWLSPAEQGYYFTFASLLALQVFFELGLNQIIMQLVSHEVAHLAEDDQGRLRGEAAHVDRLSSLARLIRRWYGSAALLFALVGGSVGGLFFAQRASEPMAGWLGIWSVLVCSTAANLWLSPNLAVMEGCGKIGQVARLRLVQSVLGYGLLWLALLMGAGLWSAAALPVVSAACTGYWIVFHGHTLRWLADRSSDPKHQVHWQTDVLPLQWRIGLSWASGYLIFNLFTPMVFSRYGAAEAGRLGLALTLFAALSTIGMSWVNAKAPNFTMHIARGQRAELNAQFRSLFVRSTVFIALACAGVVLAALYGKHIGLPLMERIAAPAVLAVLAVTTTVNAMVYSMAIYMRAHREEPMLLQSIVVGLLIAVSVYIGSVFGVLVMMALYMVISVCVSLPWTIRLFLSYRQRV